jgi:hypothetical protein
MFGALDAVKGRVRLQRDALDCWIQFLQAARCSYECAAGSQHGREVRDAPGGLPPDFIGCSGIVVSVGRMQMSRAMRSFRTQRIRGWTDNRGAATCEMLKGPLSDRRSPQSLPDLHNCWLLKGLLYWGLRMVPDYVWSPIRMLLDLPPNCFASRLAGATGAAGFRPPAATLASA